MKSLYRIISVLVGILFLYYFVHLFRELPKINFGKILCELNYIFVFGSLLAYLLSHALRAIRFAVLMGKQDFSIFHLIYLQYYTNAINLIFPFKLGEVYRIIAFRKVIKDDKRLVLTVFTEKTLDIVLLFVWALVAIILLGQAIVALNIVLWVLFVLLTGSLILFFVLPENIRTLNIFLAKRYNSKWVVRILSLNDKISEVIANIKSTLRTSASTITLLTILIWALEVVGFCYLLPFLLDKTQIWLVSILVFLSSLIPSASLGLGGLQLGFSAIDKHVADFNSLVISLTYQAFIFAPAIFFGFVLYLFVNQKTTSQQFK